VRLLFFEVRWARTIGRALLPVGLLGGVVDSLDLGEALRQECLGPPWYSALVLRASLWLTWFWPLVRLRRPTTFGGLDREAREGLLEGLLAHPSYVVRAATFYLKLTVCLALLGDERVFRRIGAYEHGLLASGQGAP
jgi:hypothetical protein